MGPLVLFALMLPFSNMPAHGTGRSCGYLGAAGGRLSYAYKILAAVSLAKGRVDHTQSYCRFRACHFDHLPASALIWSSGMSGALYYYTQFPIVRFDFIKTDRVPKFFRAATTAQRPMYALLWPHEIDEMMSRVAGRWTKVAELPG